MEENDGIQYFKCPKIDLHKNQMRTLEIFPGERGSTIECKLLVGPVGIAYTCLSYQWGTADNDCMVIVNEEPFNVRSNLHSFLVRARYIGIREKLWIDAICIDQSRVEERNHQVRLMSTIYRNASRVLIWLGDMVSLNDIVPLALERSGLWTEHELWTSSHARSFFNELAASTYWKRLWIIQEIYLARRLELIVGCKCVEFWSFAKVCVYNLSHDRSQYPRFTMLCDRENRARTSTSLERCMQLTRTAECHDVRDRIYGILGICFGIARLPVQYEHDTAGLFLDICVVVQPKRPKELEALSKQCAEIIPIHALLVCSHVIEDLMYQPYQQQLRSGETHDILLHTSTDMSNDVLYRTISNDVLYKARQTGIGKAPPVGVFNTCISCRARGLLESGISNAFLIIQAIDWKLALRVSQHDIWLRGPHHSNKASVSPHTPKERHRLQRQNPKLEW